MSGRSVIETLDLHNDCGDYHREACPSQNYGWLSPRVSFSTDFIHGSLERVQAEKKKLDEENHKYSPEFEFSMSSFNVLGSGSPGFIVPADELFHQGKLLPGFIPPSSSKDVATADSAADVTLPEMPDGCPSTTIARHLSAEATGGPSPLGCVLGPSCLRTPKGPKWRELFGVLRRVKSDSGRQRIPDESLLPPKTLQGRKKFFKQLFSSNGAAGQGGPHDPKMGMVSSPYVSSTGSRPSCSSSATSGLLPQDRNSWESSSSAHHSVRGMPAGPTAAEPRNKTAANPPQASGTGARGGDLKPDVRGRSCDQSSEGFTFNPTPGRVRASGNGSNSGRHMSPIKAPIRGANLGRSPSGRVIVRGLDRVSSSRTPSAFQEQIRALKSREIRRSPDRSGYSSVRVTPVLNVPVCMGPVLRGATKAGKGRLSNFRSFLTFKSKLPNSMSTPIATR